MKGLADWLDIPRKHHDILPQWHLLLHELMLTQMHLWLGVVYTITLLCKGKYIYTDQLKRILVLKTVCYSLRVLSTSASSSWGMSFYSPFFPSFLFPPTCLAWFSSSSIPYNNYDIMHSNYSVLLSELGWVELRFFLSLWLILPVIVFFHLLSFS